MERTEINGRTYVFSSLAYTFGHAMWERELAVWAQKLLFFPGNQYCFKLFFAILRNILFNNLERFIFFQILPDFFGEPLFLFVV